MTKLQDTSDHRLREDQEEILREYLRVATTQAHLAEGPTDTWLDAFIDPFLDIGRSALYAVERTGATFKSLVSRSLHRLKYTFKPFWNAEWDRFMAAEEAKLAAVDKKYGGVISRNMAAMGHQDLQFLGLLFNPQQYLAIKILPSSVETAMELAWSFLPGWRPLQNILKRYKEITNLGPSVISPAKSGNAYTGHGGGIDFGGGGDYGGYGGFYDHYTRPLSSLLLTEAPTRQLPPEFVDQVRAVLSSPDFAAAVARSPMMWEMHKVFVMDAVRAVQDFTRQDSPEKMKSRLGAGWSKITQEFEKESRKNNDTTGDAHQNQTEEAKKAFNQALVAAAQTEYKRAFADKLAELAKANPEAAQLYNWGISQIQKTS